MKNWNGMFKKMGTKAGVANTYPTVHGEDGQTLNAEPISDELVAEMVDRERFEVIKAENKRLQADVETLRGRLGDEYDRGHGDALKQIFNKIEEMDGRVGKKAIVQMVQDMMSDKREEG